MRNSVNLYKMEDSGAELCYSVLYYYHMILLCHIHINVLILHNHRKGQTRSTISAIILLLQRSRNFSALVYNVELFFTCAFAFLCWRIVKNNSETIEHKTNLTFLIKNVWAIEL